MFFLLFYIFIFVVIFSLGYQYSSLFKFNFEKIVLERNDNGKLISYKMNIPNYCDIHNHRYIFKSSDSIIKQSLVTGNKEDVPRNSPEGCLILNIRNKNFVEYTPLNKKFDYYIETTN